MWPRFIGFSILNWITNIVVIMFLLQYVIPQSWNPNLIALGPWFVSFVIAFIYAELAFRKKLPGMREAVTLAAIWLVIGYTLHIFYAEYLFGTARVVLLSPDIHITYVCELAAIGLAATVTRRKRIEAALGEGLED